MTALTALLAWDRTAPQPKRPVRRPLLIGDITAARAGVPELLIQMARSEDRDDPPPMD